MSREDEFREMLRATFRAEAAEHVQTITDGLLALEKDLPQEQWRERVAAVFRAAHSLKGATRAVDQTDIEACCQELEDLFAGWRQAGKRIPVAALDLAHRGIDDIMLLLRNAGAAPPEPSIPDRDPQVRPAPPGLAAVVPEQRDAPGAAAAAPFSPPSGAGAGAGTGQVAPSVHETVRIAVGKLETSLIEAEELLVAKQAMAQRVAEVREVVRRFEEWRGRWVAARLAAQLLRRGAGEAPARAGSGLAPVMEFFEHGGDTLAVLEVELHGLARSIQEGHRQTSKLVDELLEDSKKLLLLPFGTLAASLPKVVRDLCREQGKEAELVIQGEEVELDKRVLDEMKDPLLHLLRNSVDHGVEPPAERLRQGKPACARLTVRAATVAGGRVELVVEDDGAGIDTARVREVAVRQGRLTAEEAAQLDEAAARDLVFLPELSTSAMITTVSGRGLGTAIVRERVGRLGGTATVSSEPGRGTCFRLVLPATLATFRGILVEADQQVFVMPTAQVARVGGVAVADIRPVEGRETVTVDGRSVPLARLADLLGLSPAPVAGHGSGRLDFLVVGTGEQKAALVVDAILDELEVLVKPLRPPLIRVRHVAGGTVLGSGRVALVLDVADLLRSIRSADHATVVRPVAPAAPAVRSILVAEDSITSRMLIKGLLESAGYRVAVASDGRDALTQLRAGQFDLLVSDVEMPRLDGFELTAQVRADRRLAELPVILVTARETREDRERGIDAGANAYIVKSNFDQSDLLDAVRRLI